MNENQVVAEDKVVYIAKNKSVDIIAKAIEEQALYKYDQALRLDDEDKRSIARSKQVAAHPIYRQFNVIAINTPIGNEMWQIKFE